ncbi:MAG: hypothetical protein FD170_3090 [Bacteroidetes bacterium]|nr:MAG: hypothetical protein FD170_3090 [Bacteroidota bacterium]
MEKLDFKKKLVMVCKSIKTETETNLLAAIADAQQSANEYGQPKDRYDSYRAQLLTRRDMLAQQLERVQNEIGLLDRIDLTRVCEFGGFGSIVITPVQKVFISIGIGKIDMDGVGDYYAISASVPFAQAVKEKKAGDTVVFNGKKLEILDVY